MDASDKVQMFHMPSHYTSAPTQTRSLSSAAITSSYRTLFSISPSYPLFFFFIVMKYNSFSPPGPSEPDVYTLVVPSGGFWKNLICNFLQTIQPYSVSEQKKRRKKKTQLLAFTSLPFLLPVILSFLFSLVKRLHASRFPTHNAVQGGRLFELWLQRLREGWEHCVGCVHTHTHTHTHAQVSDQHCCVSLSLQMFVFSF